jgi:hypothetical protein
MALKYTGSFDSIRTQSRYIVNIYQDSYDGSPIDVILAATPVVQEWQEDDPLAPIKGSTLTINLTTSGGLELLDFYSDNDNEFRVELLGDDVIGTQITLFDGFIQQDDCSEIQVDFIHTITLTATDNLGTIKDITLGRAAELFGDIIAVGGIPVAFVPGFYIVIDYGPSWPVRPGQTFTVGGSTFTMVANLGEIDDTYDGWCIQVVENIPSPPPGTLSISYREIVSLKGYIPLITFIKLCLRATYLNLPLSFYGHISPTDGEIFVDTGETRMLEDVTLLGNTFLKNNEYMSCYDVLEIIMKRFNMTCFQSLNSWWIVRYPDLFLDYEAGETVINYYKYEENTFTYLDKFSINKSFIITTNGYVETGLLKSIVRPFRSKLETFNYSFPNELLCNSRINNLGPFISKGININGVFCYNYELPCWDYYIVESFFFPIYHITIETDEFGTKQELDRYILIRGNVLSPPDFTSSSIISNDINLNLNDTFEFSFSIRAVGAWATGNSFFFGVKLTDGVTTYWLDNNGNWTTTWTTSTLTYTPADSTAARNWNNVIKKANPVPINGILNIIINNSVTLENHWKNLNFNLPIVIAGQGQVIGHSHNASQSTKLNNVNDVEILIDNSEHPSISGTLFLTSQTGILQDKCTTWKFGQGINTGVPDAIFDNLGQLVTQTYMFQRYIPRTKYNGNLLYIRNQNGVMSNLAIFTNEFNGPLRTNKMLFGSLAIDYKNDSAEFTMWEVFNKTQAAPSDNYLDFTIYLFNILYQFNYLYENN